MGIPDHGPIDGRVVESDGSVDSISTAVVEAVAAATNARAEAMPLLLDVVDTDALDRLFNQSRTGVTAFRYCGVLVWVEADGHVSIYEGDVDDRMLP